MNLRLVLELKRLGRPMMVALNMADVARAQGPRYRRRAPVRTVGCRWSRPWRCAARGHAALRDLLERRLATGLPRPPPLPRARRSTRGPAGRGARILALGADRRSHPPLPPPRIDAIVMHPVWGLVILATLLFLIFQAVFSWAVVPMDAIRPQAGEGWGGRRMDHRAHADGPLRSLLVDGVIAGVGSVLVFLPQILILFFFILLLEDSGYLPRGLPARPADGPVGLSGARSSRCCRALPAPSRHHGDAHHRPLAGPPGDDHDRAADDLLGAAAGLRAAHRRLRPGARVGVFNLRGSPCSASTLPASCRRWAWPG